MQFLAQDTTRAPRELIKLAPENRHLVLSDKPRPTYVQKMADGSGEMHLESTIWKNGTAQTLTAEILIEEAKPKNPNNPDAEGGMRQPRYLVVEVEPGEAVSLPSTLDLAVQRVRGSMIVGGELPQLTRVDGPNVRLDPALRPSAPGTTEPLEGQDARILARVRRGGR